MSAKHTQGPLVVCVQDGDDEAFTIFAKRQLKRGRIDGDTWDNYIAVAGLNHKNFEANARRIAACWNACEGFSTEELEGADLFKDSIESGNLINELLAALEKIVEMNVQWALDQHGDATKAENMDCVRVARAAIAKVKGGAV